MTRRFVLRLVGIVTSSTAIAPRLFGGVPAAKAVYRGGTLPELDPPVAGEASTRDADRFFFRYERGEVAVSYSDVNLLEYGQKAGRRLGLAILVSPLFLLSKKRRHYLTIGYLDGQGEQQALVFELGKRIVRATLAGLEARTGLAVDYENEQARQAGRR